MAKILVTGANGFVGAHLCRFLSHQGHTVVGTYRAGRKPADLAHCELVRIDDIGTNTHWSPVLTGIDCIVHLAGRVHVMHESTHDPQAEFRKVNVDGTRQLAEAAVAASVRRFVYISSIKVNGEATGRSGNLRPIFRADDPPSPLDDYGKSKLEAEQTIQDIAQDSNLETVIVRPPLVYGAGARGNFPRLVSMVRAGVPLPLKRVKNKRSLVSVGNLVDCISRCVIHERAPGETFLVSDGLDLSTPELIMQIGNALDIKARLWPLPVGILQLAGRLTGRSDEIGRLTESLQVDIAPTMITLDWKPPMSVEEGMRAAVSAM